METRALGPKQDIQDDKSLDEKFRLAPSELDNLLRAYAYEKNPALQMDPTIKFLPITHAATKRIFYICPMSKDSSDPKNEPQLAFLWETYQEYQRSKDCNQEATLLIPMRMCRNYLRIKDTIFPEGMRGWTGVVKRQHAVLVEINLKTKQIFVHDSQGVWRWGIYPDKINETLNQVNKVSGAALNYSTFKNYFYYNIQRTSFDCGYFTYLFARSIIENGNASQCTEIIFSAQISYRDKQEFLAAHNSKAPAHFEPPLPYRNVNIVNEATDPPEQTTHLYQEWTQIDDYDPALASQKRNVGDSDTARLDSIPSLTNHRTTKANDIFVRHSPVSALATMSFLAERRRSLGSLLEAKERQQAEALESQGNTIARSNSLF